MTILYKSSSVVLELRPKGIALLTMCDQVNKNTFSGDLLDGLKGAFEVIAGAKDVKVVILTGYDSYFCSGGTQEVLLGISDGQINFTDGGFYSLPLDCEVPVISAMQGHGIGGGFVFGLFGDHVILSRESIYTTNFMRYGFTPGFGSTLVLKEKLGIALAQEMLMGAANYRGEELRQRGISFPVCPRAEVLEKAQQYAELLAEKPRVSLITLKEHLVSELRSKLPKIAAQEVEMHDKTFNLPEVRENISELFGK